MITMVLDSPDGQTLILGLTKVNAKMLARGDIKVPLMRPIQVSNIFIVYGETKPDIINKIAAAGVDFPQAVKDSAADDPD